MKSNAPTAVPNPAPGRDLQTSTEIPDLTAIVSERINPAMAAARAKDHVTPSQRRNTEIF